MTAYRTQKAIGMTVLSTFGLNQVPHTMFNLPLFSVKSLDVNPKEIIGYFVRPCPVRPRHGFVESRRVKNRKQAQRIIDETRAADPEAELLLMNEIPTRYSAIWTPDIVTIGKGNDGATSGKNCVTLPTTGDLLSKMAYDAAQIKDSPYVELVYDKYKLRANLVQLRDGPKVTSQVDYIPSEVKVENIIEPKGMDLLEWERTIGNMGRGTVVYHPDGSLASHYGVHCVLNNIPVLVSRKPQIGEVLMPNMGGDNKNIDMNELMYGFHMGASYKLDRLHAADVMLAACHHVPLWMGKFDRLIGFGMGAAWRLTVCAALGEMRHYWSRDKRARDQVYTEAWNHVLSRRFIKKFVQSLWYFKHGNWDASMGGQSWYKACVNAYHMYKSLKKRDMKGALEWFNKLVNSAHNNGWMFNKFADIFRFNVAAKKPVAILLVSAPMLHMIAKFPNKHHKMPRLISLPTISSTPKSAPRFSRDIDHIEMCGIEGRSIGNGMVEMRFSTKQYPLIKYRCKVAGNGTCSDQYVDFYTDDGEIRSYGYGTGIMRVPLSVVIHAGKRGR